VELLEAIEDLDDVQDVHSKVDLTDVLVAELDPAGA
jgi:hypothetical protein